MQGDELKLILCRMAPGMSLTVPDHWIDRHFPGSNAERAKAVSEIARQYLCVIKQNYASQTFEKQEVPYTG